MPRRREASDPDEGDHFVRITMMSLKTIPRRVTELASLEVAIQLCLFQIGGCRSADLTGGRAKLVVGGGSLHCPPQNCIEKKMSEQIHMDTDSNGGGGGPFNTHTQSMCARACVYGSHVLYLSLEDLTH